MLEHFESMMHVTSKGLEALKQLDPWQAHVVLSSFAINFCLDYHPVILREILGDRIIELSCVALFSGQKLTDDKKKVEAANSNKSPKKAAKYGKG